MPDSSAPELTRLLAATDPAEQDAAWTDFVRAYTRTILAALRSLGRDHDLLMDRYTFVLEHLRADGCRRLRSFGDPERTDCRVWLFVVARRLALDHYRHTYGRSRSRDDPAEDEGRATRRRLIDLVGEQLDPAELSAPADGRPDTALARRERDRLLESALRRLAPRDQLLLRLRFSQELSAREIAGMMAFESAGQVYRRIESVLKTLRSELERLGIEEMEP
jgi:RNA polymerase sigma factor (sigma-70 family)